jgi:hypothetical protein
MTAVPVAFLLLAVGDHLANASLQANYLVVDCHPGPGMADALFDIAQQRGVVRCGHHRYDRFRLAHTFSPCDFFCRLGLLPRRHFGVCLKQLFQPLGVVLETAADVDALQHFVVTPWAWRGLSGIGLRVVPADDGGREMRLASQQVVFGADGEVGLVLLGEQGER